MEWAEDAARHPTRRLKVVWSNAVARKELRTRLRSRDFRAIVTLYTAILGTVVVIFLLQHGGSATGPSAHAGAQLFEVLAIFQLFLVLFVTPVSIATSVSGERQSQTWDLLLVTRLSSFDIIWGKLVAGLAFNLLLLLAAVPLFSSVYLFGGVAPEDALHTCVVLFATVVLLGMTSLFVSVLSYRPTVSVIISSAVSLLLGIGISALVVYLEAGIQLDVAPPTPVAQIDPLVALLSVLPSGTGGPVLGGVGAIDHTFGLPLRLPLWEAFGLLALSLSILLLALSSLVIRLRPPRLAQAIGN